MVNKLEATSPLKEKRRNQCLRREARWDQWLLRRTCTCLPTSSCGHTILKPVCVRVNCPRTREDLSVDPLSESDPIRPTPPNTAERTCPFTKETSWLSRTETPEDTQAISCTFTSPNPLESGAGSWLLSREDSLPVLSPDRSLVTRRSAFRVCTSFPMLISPRSLIIWVNSCLPLVTESPSVSRTSSHSKCIAFSSSSSPTRSSVMEPSLGALRLRFHRGFVVTLSVQQLPEGDQRDGVLPDELLLLVPGIVSPLQPLELGQSRGRGLVQQQRHGLRLLRLGHQHRVAAQHHRLVLHLVPVNPREHLGQPRVRHAVGDPVQQVQVSRPLGFVVHSAPCGCPASWWSGASWCRSCPSRSCPRSCSPPRPCSRPPWTGWWWRCPGRAPCTWGPRWWSSPFSSWTWTCCPPGWGRSRGRTWRRRWARSSWDSPHSPSAWTACLPLSGRTCSSSTAAF